MSSLALKHIDRYPFAEARQKVARLFCQCANELYGENVDDAIDEVVAKMVIPKFGRGELSIPCFTFTKRLKKSPQALAQEIGNLLSSKGETDAKDLIQKVEVEAAYVNIFLSLQFLGSVLDKIVSGNFLQPLPQDGKDRVMIEYSQPNTHKAFHVGHMRNVALGSFLVNLFEQMGHPVVAANYFGDEGAHIAKCLWLLQKTVRETQLDIESVPVEKRGEWLGDMYAKAVELLDLSAYTSMPYPGVVAAKVLSKEKHPAADAPANWHAVRVSIGGDEISVVCGGSGYNAGDLVAYVPVGGRANGKLVEAKDMKGVMSCGVILARKELGLEDAEEKKEDEASDKNGKGKGGKAPKGAAPPASAGQIFVLPADTPVCIELIELGRLPNTDIPADQKLSEVLRQRNEAVGQSLRIMEEADPENETVKLYRQTRQWSLDEFKRIYSWLNARFDHDFFESEVSEESRQMCLDYYEKGVLIKSEGAIGADLAKYDLGFCVLIKSNGAGLYATKDLALARRKFDEFKVDKSIYVVDAAQALHFKQVFKTLELMGYKQAEKCYHLPYGLVVLPDGKMSSRKGTVIYFSSLKNMLAEQIDRDFLDKYKKNHPSNNGNEAWADDEIAEARRRIAVGTIKYGMLNHDAAKDIVFELAEWAAKTGNTGPYNMYAYARIRSIDREVTPLVPSDAKVEYSLLVNKGERELLTLLNNFWPVVELCMTNCNPSPLCGYVFDLAQSFSSWYEQVSVKRAESADAMLTRLHFVRAIASAIQRGLQILGIQTLERM